MYTLELVWQLAVRTVLVNHFSILNAVQQLTAYLRDGNLHQW